MTNPVFPSVKDLSDNELFVLRRYLYKFTPKEVKDEFKERFGAFADHFAEGHI